MKHVYLLIIVQLLFLNISFSQSLPNTVLWKLKNKKGRISYLLGTQHDLNGDVFLKRFPIVLEKLKQSDVFISEIGDQRGQETLNIDNLFYKGDTTNKKLLSNEAYNIIMTYFKSKENDSAFLSKLEKGRPILLHLAFIELNMDSSEGFNGQNSLVQLDTYLGEIAKNNGKKIFALETGDDRSKALLASSVSDTKILKQVIAEIKAEKNNNGSADKKIDPYSKLLQTNYFLNSWGEDYGGVKERNELWTPRIIAFTDIKNCFIAVGVGHLIGKYGLINKLRKKGYAVTPVKMN